jgi:DHA3 family macrolide efflux protein-like MFS transporter
MIGGGILLSAWGGFRKKIHNMLAGMAFMGGSAILIGLAPETGFLLAGVAFLVEGISNTVMNGGAFALLQATIKPDMQGRVFSLIMSVGGGMAPLGLLISAPVVEFTGVQTWFIFAGAASVGLAMIALFIPDVMHIEETSRTDHLVELRNIQYPIRSGED